MHLLVVLPMYTYTLQTLHKNTHHKTYIFTIRYDIKQLHEITILNQLYETFETLFYKHNTRYIQMTY